MDPSTIASTSADTGADTSAIAISSTPVETSQIVIQGNVPFSEADLEAIAAIPDVTNVAFTSTDPTHAMVTCHVPKDTGAAKAAVMKIARMFPNTPVRWSSTDAV